MKIEYKMMCYTMNLSTDTPPSPVRGLEKTKSNRLLGCLMCFIYGFNKLSKFGFFLLTFFFFQRKSKLFDCYLNSVLAAVLGRNEVALDCFAVKDDFNCVVFCFLLWVRYGDFVFSTTEYTLH